MSSLCTLMPIFALAEGNRCGNYFGSYSRDQVDFIRDWGVRLLKDNDAAFTSREYLKELIWASRPGVVSYFEEGTPYYSEYTRLFHVFTKLIRQQTYQSAMEYDVMRFTQSGTDANNALYQYAEWAFKKRTGQTAKRANLLFFKGAYGGTHGRIAEIGIRYGLPSAKEFMIPTPHAEKFSPTEGKELDYILKLEDEAIDFIRQQTAKLDLEIGGIFIEPIAAFGNVYVYRPEFMKRLRELADDLRVPIFADEILTGGGRTGKFWAFQHYPGFEPDIITFGKGLGISGIIDTNRIWHHEGISEPNFYWPQWRSWAHPNNSNYPDYILDNTSRANPLTLVQANQILRRIIEGRLVENAQVVGDYFVEQLIKRAEAKRLDHNIHGVGMLISVGNKTEKLTRAPIHHYMGRWMPPISTTKEDVDSILD